MSQSHTVSSATPANTSIEALLAKSRQASRTMAQLSSQEKNQALETLAQLMAQHEAFLLEENQKDLDEQRDTLAPALFQRLKLDSGKVANLVQGARDLVKLTDPVGQLLLKTQLDDGLILEKRAVPLGVIGIIFESRPDVIPQILSLILKSGNAVVLKGGREAHHSNQAFMTLIDKLNAACPFLPEGWGQLIVSREAVHDMLNYPQYVDLVIPRGSNALVQSIMANTRIPVLGHADGICHLYVHHDAPVDQSVNLIWDSKTQYPSACNALETLLIHQEIAPTLLPSLAKRFSQESEKVTLRGCPDTQRLMGSHYPMAAATEEDWKTEYGDLTLAVKIVGSEEEAIEHINRYGSGHTDTIVSPNVQAQKQFLSAVDSANVFVNCSTRFADGFRYGFGAEIGISTARTHARGPVGIDGLVIYKYFLQGDGQCVTDYSGSQPKRTFQHRSLPLDE